MKVFCTAAVGVLLVLFSEVFARADVIVDNLGEGTEGYFGPIGNDANTNDFLIGQEFTLPAGANLYQLDSIALLLSSTNGGGSITVSLWKADQNNNPSNEIATLTPQIITATQEAVFVLSSNVTLSPGKYYAVASPTTPANNGLVWWAYASDTNWNGTGAMGGYAFNESGTWTNYNITNLPQQLSVVATPILPAMIKISRQAALTKLTWTSTNGYVVDSATNLSEPTWLAITNAPKFAGGANMITNVWNAPMQFFRLRQVFAVSNLTQKSGGWDGPIGSDNNNNDFLLGEEFTLPAGNYRLNGVTLALNPAHGKANITASIWNVGPQNTPSDEFGMVATQQVGTAGNINFTPSAPMTLPGGSYYVVAAPATASDNAKVGWYWTTNSTWTGFGILDGFAGDLDSWQTASVSDGPYLLSIQATPISP